MKAESHSPKKTKAHEVFATLAARASHAAGSIWGFGSAIIVVLFWGLTGPVFKFSDTWQLVINTGTTIVTFLMVFLLQHAQNHDTRALQMKLDELIAAMPGASNRLIDVEDLSEKELEHLQELFHHLSQKAQRLEPGTSMTVEKEEKLRRAESPGKHHHRNSNGRTRAPRKSV